MLNGSSKNNPLSPEKTILKENEREILTKSPKKEMEIYSDQLNIIHPPSTSGRFPEKTDTKQNHVKLPFPHSNVLNVHLSRDEMS